MDEILNIIIGLIIGVVIAIFYNSYNVLYRGPNSNEIKNKIYKDNDGNCYRLVPVVHICPTSISMIN
ncbi:MAG: hypothetical protein Edafosvirus30_5 [Edafosvirus sp.]|uniref:Uncharacterized protein n=1 Tax=Edafosvirus sp. TaxID=2487765 RepID=A0A3G4ZWM6_9VIRU|nr:MAG: hypothetical protein Edafosvirus30_5 [Edafosvirus sp.]